MGSSALLPIIVDLMHQAEMDAFFGFTSSGKDSFWFAVRHDDRTSKKELDCFRETIASESLGSAFIDEDFLSEELRKRLDYCKMVFGMDIPEKPIKLSEYLL